MEITEKISIYRNFLDKGSANSTFYMLTEGNLIKWHDELLNINSGVMDKIPRKMAYISDVENFTYKYADKEFPGQTWNVPHLEEIRVMLEMSTGINFNSVLLNWYKDGKDVINFHADKEEILKGGLEGSVIACVNLGATRKFWFKKIKSEEPKFFIEVNHGDLLIMNAGCQSEYLHAILKESEITESRVSLTFREVI